MPSCCIRPQALQAATCSISTSNSAPMRGGPGPFGAIDMGGMFSVLKVREHPEQADPNGWYDNPKGTVAAKADETRARADGIDLGRGT